MKEINELEANLTKVFVAGSLTLVEFLVFSKKDIIGEMPDEEYITSVIDEVFKRMTKDAALAVLASKCD